MPASQNRAAFMTGLNTMEIRPVPMPEPKAGQVLVRVGYVGICGSDVHYYERGRIAGFVVKGDFILGHECAGTVAALGEGVTALAVGDTVALEPGITCGQCEYCVSGRYNLCPHVEFFATPPYHGCFTNYVAFPAHRAFKLPGSLTAKEGALIEPLAVGLEAAETGGVRLGGTVAILGAGCIGLVTLLACKAAGAAEIIVADRVEKRLRKALELGATRVVNAAETDAAEAVAAATGGRGADVVMETAGAVQTVQQTVEAVKRGGTIVLVGMAPQDTFPFSFARLMDKVADIRPVFRYKNQYPAAVKAIAAGKIDISGIVTHEFAFDDIAEAFRVNSEQKNDVVKTVIRMG